MMCLLLFSLVMEMIPGMSNLLQGQKGDAGTQKIKSYMTIMDSMTDEGPLSFLFSFSFIESTLHVMRLLRCDCYRLFLL
jgi:hypothetical protein